MRPIFQQRSANGAFNLLIKELEKEDPDFYFDYFMMYPEQFKIIHNLIKPHIQIKKTNWRQPMSTEERLVVTLRYLATGESKRSLQFQYRIDRSTLTSIISDV